MTISGPDNIRAPLIIIPEHVWCTLQTYVKVACPHEINGFGMVERLENCIVVREIFITPQSAGEGHARIDPEDLGRFRFRLRQKGYQLSDMRFQWHSHGYGQAYCSPTDMATIDATRGEYLISLVTNRAGDIHCRFDVFKPARLGCVAEVKILLPNLNEEELRGIRQEVAQKVLVTEADLQSSDANEAIGAVLVGHENIFTGGS